MKYGKIKFENNFKITLWLVTIPKNMANLV